MIEVQGVSHAIGPAAILRDIDLVLPRGALTALMTVVQTVFYARFYVAAREREATQADALPLS